MPGADFLKLLPGIFLFVDPLQILLDLFFITVPAGPIKFCLSQFFRQIALMGKVFRKIMGIFVADAMSQLCRSRIMCIL